MQFINYSRLHSFRNIKLNGAQSGNIIIIMDGALCGKNIKA